MTSIVPTLVAVSVPGARLQNIKLTANGTTSVALPSPGAFHLFVSGTWDSGSLTVNESPDGTEKFECIAAITSDGGAYYANTGNSKNLDLVLASVASAADLDVVLISV